MKPRSLVLSCALLLCACIPSRLDDTLEAWRGRSSSELIAQWGPPLAVLADGKDGKTLVYIKDETYTTPGQWTTTTIPDPRIDTGSVSYPISIERFEPGQTIERPVTYAFRVDREGRIYAWSRVDR
jgi:hypothetical protein